MNIVLVGPGRAGMSLAHALLGAGHQIVGVLGRDSVPAAAVELKSPPLTWDGLLPAADLLIIGTRDDAIVEVAGRLAPRAIGVKAAVHLSGSVGVGALGTLGGVGVTIGGFHPLQSLPSVEIGLRRLAGAWAGITTDDPDLHALLTDMAVSIDMIPFDLADDVRPLYHAGASAAANYLVGSLALAERLFSAAGVPWAAAAPMVEAVVGNVMDVGPAAALTGPIARGDVATVLAQREAIRKRSPELEAAFTDIGRAVAHLAGRSEEFEGVLK